jgi:hypothetical protein
MPMIDPNGSLILTNMTETAYNNLFIFLEYSLYVGSMVCGVALATKLLKDSELFQELLMGDIE